MYIEKKDENNTILRRDAIKCQNIITQKIMRVNEQGGVYVCAKGFFN